mmetsp:Transcript_19589/g.74129  ORF Transcript_19589/g.74129 Transcript_19589/m.74129 type:complete len:218 (+) Transcript_19589:1356-2009(+)
MPQQLRRRNCSLSFVNVLILKLTGEGGPRLAERLLPAPRAPFYDHGLAVKEARPRQIRAADDSHRALQARDEGETARRFEWASLKGGLLPCPALDHQSSSSPSSAAICASSSSSSNSSSTLMISPLLISASSSMSSSSNKSSSPEVALVIFSLACSSAMSSASMAASSSSSSTSAASSSSAPCNPETVSSGLAGAAGPWTFSYSASVRHSILSCSHW